MAKLIKQPPRRMSRETQKEQRLRNQIKRLEVERKIFYEEMIARGEEISRMIRIFLMVKNRLPFGVEKKIEAIAKEYALRNDKNRGSVPKAFFGEIDIRADGTQDIVKRKAERFNDKTHKVSL